MRENIAMAASNNRELGFVLEQIRQDQAQIRQAQERAENDRREILGRIADIDDQFKILNGRTRKLEEENDRIKSVWGSDVAKAIQVFNSNVNNFNSSFKVARDWVWRAVLVGVVMLIAGNQAAGKLIDYFIMKLNTGQ